MSTFVYMTRCDGCGHCVDICPSDIMHIDETIRRAKNIDGWDTLFLILFGLSNLVLFGGIYWSKFAHMFYKPGAAIQKNLAEADGSNENLPYPTDKPKQFGLGIKREAPKHY